MHPDLIKAIEHAILRIPLSLSYDLAIFASICISMIGCFLIIVRNDILPIIGDIISVIGDAIDVILDVINYLIGQIEDVCFCTIHRVYFDLSAVTDAGVLRDVPDVCMEYESVFNIIIGLIDIANASILCPVRRYVEPIPWVASALDIIIQYNDYTSSCTLSSDAELCIYCSLGYLIYAIGIFLVLCIVVYATREIWVYFIYYTYKTVKMLR